MSCVTACGGLTRSDTGISVRVGDEVIEGYQPRTALVTGQHRPVAAKFPAIDVHCHWGLDVDPQDMISMHIAASR